MDWMFKEVWPRFRCNCGPRIVLEVVQTRMTVVVCSVVLRLCLVVGMLVTLLLLVPLWLWLVVVRLLLMIVVLLLVVVPWGGESRDQVVCDYVLVVLGCFDVGVDRVASIFAVDVFC